MNYFESEIKSQERYLESTKNELEGFKELEAAFEHFSIGFAKIARFVKSYHPALKKRVEDHEKRIEEIKKERIEYNSNKPNKSNDESSRI